MFNKLKQFKDLRDQSKKIQSGLAGKTVEGSAAWGKIKMVMDGNQSVTRVTIDQELLQNKSKLEQAVKDVINETIKKSQRLMAEQVKQMGGLNLPGLTGK